MSSARHRAVHRAGGRHVADPAVSASPSSTSGRSFRRAVVTSSAIVAVAGLSLTVLMPADAATLHSSATGRHGHSHISTPASQSYTVPSTVTDDASTARDEYTATPLAVILAEEAATAAARSSAQKKAAAIAAILAAPVSVITVGPATTTGTGTASAAKAVTPTNPGAATTAMSGAATSATATSTTATSTSATATDPENATTVTATTSGTVADRMSATTLKAASATADEIVASAVQYVGVVPYVHDGADPKTGFDCSGLVMYVYGKFGITVPHDVDAIAALGSPVALAKAQPGDLVVYPHQHIGIYLGDGYMVDAPNVGRDVEVQAVWGAPTYVHIKGA